MHHRRSEGLHWQDVGHPLEAFGRTPLCRPCLIRWLRDTYDRRWPLHAGCKRGSNASRAPVRCYAIIVRMVSDNKSPKTGKIRLAARCSPDKFQIRREDAVVHAVHSRMIGSWGWLGCARLIQIGPVHLPFRPMILCMSQIRIFDCFSPSRLTRSVFHGMPVFVPLWLDLSLHIHRTA